MPHCPQFGQVTRPLTLGNEIGKRNWCVKSHDVFFLVALFLFSSLSLTVCNEGPPKKKDAHVLWILHLVVSSEPTRGEMEILGQHGVE